MASKRKPLKKPNSNQIEVYVEPDEKPGMGLARGVLRPTVQAAVTLKAYDKSYGDLDLNRLINALSEQTKASNDGDMRRAEAMLTTQAHTLDAIFNNLAQKAIRAEYINQFDTYLKLGLRAQSQCRTTWEALSAIKHPPMMGYVRQANIAHGPQQVNNEADASRTRENENPQNKQLEQTDGERLDTRTTGKTGKDNPAMATVGEVDGAEDRCG
jgi:hypothetical protein